MTSLFEAYLKSSGYDIGEASNRLEKIQSLSTEQFSRWENQHKWEIARYHFDNNKFYRAKIGNYFPDRWEDLPILEKSDYQQNIEKLFSIRYSKKNTYIANTSGSSGQPFFFVKNKEAHAMTWALIKDRYSWHGLGLNAKQARFLGTPLEMTSNIQEKIKNFIINRVLFPVFDLSDHNLEIFLNKIKKTKFKYIYGYTNSLLLFAQYLLKKEIILQNECPTLSICITTSEVLRDEDRSILSKSFGLKILNEYGISETGGIVAFDDRYGNWLINRESQFMEIVDGDQEPLKDGNMGEIIITDLYNKAMPFIRYRVGDIGKIKKNIIIDGYKVLDGLQGRINDNIHLPSGKISPGLTFYYISRSILESSGVLKEFIIRQIRLNTFVFDIVCDRNLYGHEIKEIQVKMDIYLELGLKLEVNRVDKIIRPKSGKIKHFYSELNT